jgi:hypothetical protein
MILPRKHIRLTESYFGFGGYLLNFINNPIDLDNLWVKFEKVNESKEFPAYHSFDNFLLAINYLFIIGAINQDSRGYIYRETN